ncbi:sporulation protein YunB, partial [Phascolarctobacterium faecium]|uniref:sporulation protein YunB n=1 Tax=Phascolarctobacterium faecium TaxID=33025 RepID=UPI003FD774C9
ILTDSSMGYKTKVKNYGINNVLLELYLDISVSSSLLTPVSKEEIKDNFSILIASRIIAGSVPDYYNGILESTSPLVNS